MSYRRLRRWHVVAMSLGGLLLAFIVVKLVHRSPAAALASVSLSDRLSENQLPPDARQLLDVQVVKPAPGGLERSTTLPGTVIAFESAQLFAKVPGYLKSQSVDIGDTVRARPGIGGDQFSGDAQSELEQATAAVDQAKAQVTQADARITTAQADHEAALAAIAKAQAAVSRCKSDREYREIQLKRITSLYQSDSVEERLVDEQNRQLGSARSAEEGALAEVTNSKALAHGAEARVAQAKADAVAARANLEVAEAALDKAKVFVDYLKIVSPYDGVVVKRNFFRGDFIRSADQQTTVPLLAIDRTDEMRVIVQVPDLNVPFTRKGAPAVVKIDALPGTKFEGTVARVAVAEHSETRTMRAEIDLKNDQGVLSPGMYGYATITLPTSPDAMRIPTSALVGTATDGWGTVCLVKDGVVKIVKVRMGRDNGEQIEVLDGLSSDDEIAVTHAAELAEGMNVKASPIELKPRSTAHASLR